MFAGVLWLTAGRIHCVFDFELTLFIVHSETCYVAISFLNPPYRCVAPRGVTTHGLRKALTEEASLR